MTPEISRRIFDTLQGSGVGHIYPKYEKGDCAYRQVTPYFKTAEEFHAYLIAVVKIDVQLVPNKEHTLIDFDMGKMTIEDKDRLCHWLNAHPLFSNTLWYQTKHGRHYYFKFDRSEIIGERDSHNKCLTIPEYPELSIDIPWNGKCPPTAGRVFRGDIKQPLELTAWGDLGLEFLKKPSSNIDILIPTGDAELSPADEERIQAKIKRLKKKCNCKPGADHRLKIVDGVHQAVLALCNMLAWERVSYEDSEEILKNFLSEHVENPPAMPEYLKEFHRMYESAREYVEKKQREKTENLERILDNHVYLIEDNSYMEIDTASERKPEAFANIIFPYIQAVSPLRKLHEAQAIKTSHTYEYFPGSGKFHYEAEEGKTYFNIWSRPKIVPIAEEPTVIIEHLNRMFPKNQNPLGEDGPSYQDILLNFLAHVLQKPGIKHNFAVLIVGESHGTGKTFFTEMMVSLIGFRNCMKVGNKAVQGIDNTWTEKEFVYINDIDQSEKKSFIDDMKDTISDQFLSIKKMRKSPYQKRNYMNLIATTNHEDAIYFSEGDEDRRWCVIKTDMKPESPEYYNSLFGCLQNKEYIAKVYHWLMSRDLSDYNPKRIPPMTEAKREMVDLSLSKLDEQLDHANMIDWETTKVICGSDLQRPGEPAVAPRVIHRKIKSRGFKKIRRVVINGKKENIYIREDLKAEEIEKEIARFLDKKEHSRLASVN